jgi:hypothetical protein
MKIFFDTEFTGLHKNTTLISIGLVDENGRTFYAEFSDYDESQCDDWIKENVINNLKLGKYEHFSVSQENTEVYGSKNFIRKHLNDWLSEYDYVELVSDCCHYDMVLFIDIFGGAFDIPKQVNPACHDINQDLAKRFMVTEREAFDVSREALLKARVDSHIIEVDKHNSLYDAKVIKELYNIYIA